jgi:hypothetical protein
MYNKNKDSLLKDVLSPTVIGLAVAIHLLIVFLFCAVSSFSEKEVEETLKPAEEEKVALTNNLNQVSSQDQNAVNEPVNTQTAKKDTASRKENKETIKDTVKKAESENSTHKDKLTPPPSRKSVVKEVKKPAQKVVRRVTNPVAKKKAKTSSDIKKGQFKKGPLKKR